MTIQTKLTKQLGIVHPIVQGGMMWVGLPVLAAAVSNAGGLGIITGLTQGTPEKLRDAIRHCRTLTDKPFAVNLTFLPTINPPPYMDFAKVIIEENIRIVETAGGPEAATVIVELKKKGIYVIHKCTTIRHAIAAQDRMKVDAISMDGFECAGHPGETDVGGLVLLPLAAAALKIPFIASGGLANGRQLAAVLALGASGMNCGTLFMATDEAPIHRKIKETIVSSSELDTIHLFRTMNNTARVYKNKPATEAVSIERRPGGAKFEDIQHLVSGARGKTVYENGDKDAGVWSAGLSMALVKEIKPCKKLVEDIVAESEQVTGNNFKLHNSSSKL